MALKIWVRMPWTIDAIAITVVTPMTTPRIVRPERSLLARSESRAIATPSPTLRMPTRASTAVYSARSAVMGSSRAAREAGNTPKIDARAPRRARAPPPPTRGVIRAGSGVKVERPRPRAPQPASTPCRPPRVESTIASMRNCRRMSRPRGAERLAKPDLAGALGHAHEHDVHDHDAADHDADADHRRDGGEQHLRELPPERDQGVGLVHGEVVRPRRAGAGARSASPPRRAASPARRRRRRPS